MKYSEEEQVFRVIFVQRNEKIPNPWLIRNIESLLCSKALDLGWKKNKRNKDHDGFRTVTKQNQILEFYIYT